MNQKTIIKDILFKGFGVHSGKESSITLKPADIDTGIIFYKNKEKIELDFNNLIPSQLCTKISKNNNSISTIEHILSAVYGLDITNIEIHVNGEEIPILDGCTSIFVNSLNNIIISQNKESNNISLDESIIYTNKDKFIIAIPNKNLEINYFIEYNHKLPNFMFHKYIHSCENYIKEISKARTFGYKEELEYLKNNGLANGANINNTLAIDNNQYISPLNYYNEPVRHKILDLIGDMAFLKRKLNAQIFAYKTGHKEHLEFIKKIVYKFSIL